MNWPNLATAKKTESAGINGSVSSDQCNPVITQTHDSATHGHAIRKASPNFYIFPSSHLHLFTSYSNSSPSSRRTARGRDTPRGAPPWSWRRTWQLERRKKAQRTNSTWNHAGSECRRHSFHVPKPADVRRRPICQRAASTRSSAEARGASLGPASGLGPRFGAHVSGEEIRGIVVIKNPT